jgi:gliding motility-associated-like protein
VFNRWGQLVYESQDPDAGWNGMNEGKSEEMGTYIWQLNYQGSEHARSLDQRMTGYVVLIR